VIRAGTPSIVALIPARSGSKRAAHKNVRPLQGHPVVAYTICAAQRAGIFSTVVVSTDSEAYAEIARYYGAEVPFLRPDTISADTSPDIDWVEHALDQLRASGRTFDAFSILRPTSPFRRPDTIRRAWDRFLSAEGIDSLRAVEKVEQHPGKMWVIRGDRLLPLLPLTPADAPWHSQQYAALPEVYIQNASLEIAWSAVVRDGRTIAGTRILPFLTEGSEGLDINRPEDWWHCMHLIERGEALLPEVEVAPYPTDLLPAYS
jgi:CMP-N,N'-diacetyllegionaminic acid synthase